MYKYKNRWTLATTKGRRSVQQKMPRKEKIYVSCYVYRLIDSTTNETFYIGSTSQRLSARMAAHRSCAMSPSGKQYNSAVYQRIRAVGVENVNIILISEHNGITKMELERFEQEAIDSNTARPSSSHEVRTTGGQQITNAKRAHVSDSQRSDIMKEWRLNNCNKHSCELCGYGSHNVANYRQHMAGKSHALADALRRLAEAEAALAIAKQMTDSATDSASVGE